MKITKTYLKQVIKEEIDKINLQREAIDPVSLAAGAGIVGAIQLASKLIKSYKEKKRQEQRAKQQADQAAAAEAEKQKRLSSQKLHSELDKLIKALQNPTSAAQIRKKLSAQDIDALLKASNKANDSSYDAEAIAHGGPRYLEYYKEEQLDAFLKVAEPILKRLQTPTTAGFYPADQGTWDSIEQQKIIDAKKAKQAADREAKQKRVQKALGRNFQGSNI